MQIKKIIEVNPMMVYAVKTTTGTFIADGLAHHNCEQCNVYQASSAQRYFKQAVISRIGKKRESALDERVYIKKDLQYYKDISKKYNKKFRILNK